jgi:ketosteroid isomerase-like protein
MKTILKKSLVIVSFLSVITSAPIFAQTNSEISKETRDEIIKLNQSIENAVQKKNLSDVPAMYVDDATILTPGGKKLHGRKEIATFWYDLANCKEFKSEITELGGNGKMVYQVGKWTMTVEKDGKLVTYSTDVVLVWKRESSYDYKIQLQSLNNTVTVTEDNAQPNSAQVK